MGLSGVRKGNLELYISDLNFTLFRVFNKRLRKFFRNASMKTVCAAIVAPHCVKSFILQYLSRVILPRMLKL
jgi:hypothetical protein